MDICSRLTIFEEKDLKWPQQPLTESIKDIGKLGVFVNIFNKKGSVVLILIKTPNFPISLILFGQRLLRPLEVFFFKNC